MCFYYFWRNLSGMVRAAGLAGWEFLPLTRSKGAAFPLLSAVLGTRLFTLKECSAASADIAHRQDALPKVRKLYPLRALLT
jgi:hypothetical protein